MEELSYFDKVYFINLDRRQDRLAQVTSELARIGLAADRVAGYDFSDKDHSNLGRMGCTLSHFRIVLDAKHLGLRNVLILEDDVVFADNFAEIAKGATGELANVDWDLFYFGYSNFGYGHETLTPIGQYLATCESVYLGHCYAINRSAFDKMIDMVLQSRHSEVLDWMIVHNAHRFRTVCSVPRVAFQRAGISDVETGSNSTKTW